VGAARRNLNRLFFASGLHQPLGRVYGGIGTVFLMHRVVADKHDSLARNLSISVDFLDTAIRYLRAQSIDIVSLDEALRRLSSSGSVRRFAVLSFDDGYRDNLTLGLPVLERHQAPATVFVPAGAPDRRLDAWWLRLERALRSRTSINLDEQGLPPRLDFETDAAKVDALRLLSIYVSQDMPARKGLAEHLLPSSEISEEALLAELFMDWNELRKFAGHPLITVGAHTVRHAPLAALSEAAAEAEIAGGRHRLQHELDAPVDHFAYPFGDASTCGEREFALARRAGFRSAVTTRAGSVFKSHAHFPLALPRYVLGGVQENISDTALDLAGIARLRGRDWFAPVVTS
jgi:peptidoglycan/xylan/chitin deacetylase (PgdA/CDA1 family)